MVTWDPVRYLQFSDARSRPFRDLVARVPTTPRSIVDLGCGPGHLSVVLRDRWPDARITGVDSSAEMIARADADNTDPAAHYIVADVETWEPAEPVDLIVSNAMFQWVDDQFAVIGRLLSVLDPDRGTIAVQVPDNADAPTHRTMAAIAAQPEFAADLTGVRRLHSTRPEDYLAFFAERGMAVDAWSTTYLHVLHGDDPVFDWISGTGARPYLQALDGAARDDFVRQLKAALRAAYPSFAWGTPLPFRRTFVVATRT